MASPRKTWARDARHQLMAEWLISDELKFVPLESRAHPDMSVGSCLITDIEGFCCSQVVRVSLFKALPRYQPRERFSKGIRLTGAGSTNDFMRSGLASSALSCQQYAPVADLEVLKRGNPAGLRRIWVTTKVMRAKLDPASHASSRATGSTRHPRYCCSVCGCVRHVRYSCWKSMPMLL